VWSSTMQHPGLVPSSSSSSSREAHGVSSGGEARPAICWICSGERRSLPRMAMLDILLSSSCRHLVTLRNVMNKSH